jgi:hypothetical protein
VHQNRSVSSQDQEPVPPVLVIVVLFVKSIIWNALVTPSNRSSVFAVLTAEIVTVLADEVPRWIDLIPPEPN